MSRFEKFLILCSGSNFSLLKRAKTDTNKHVGLGGVILFTGILAALSSGYALFTVFDEIWFSVLFGILWGLMILNLDRFIVTSMRKSGGFFRQFWVALPRLLLATLLGIVISKPLELKIFENEINSQLQIIINRNKTNLQDSIDIRYTSLIQPLQQEKNEIYARIKSLQEDYSQSSLDLEKEIVGTQSETTTGKIGYGMNAKRKEELKNQKKEALDLYQSEVKMRLIDIEKRLDTFSTQKNNEVNASKGTEDNYTGLAARMQALNELSTNSEIIKLAALFITGLFISIEIAPVLVKLISPEGPYDYLLEKHEHSFKSYSEEAIQITDLQSEARIETQKKQINKRLKSIDEEILG